MGNDGHQNPRTTQGQDPRDTFPGFQGVGLPVLQRYVTSRSSEAERRLVEAWAATAAERRRYLDALRRLYSRAEPCELEGAERAWGEVMARMERPAADDAPPFRPPWEEPAVRVDVGRQRRAPKARVLHGAFAGRRSPWALTVSAAATIILAAAGLHAVGTANTPAPASNPMRVIATGRGQRAEIQLDDGTHVMLGVESRLRLAPDFGTRTRQVYLDGTAYFHVAHNAAMPFEVHTANAVTRDIGTQFVVQAYPGDGGTAVVVTEGEVALRRLGVQRERVALLTRDERGVLADGRDSASVSVVDPARYTAWMRGRLVFRDAPLAAVARELGRWYDVDVELGDSTLATVPFSASFAAESLRETIATITTVLPLRAVRRGSVVTLFRR
jgi:transmembrane sensor